MDDFLCMSCGQLRDYLSLRCLSTSGVKSELVARAFVAWEQQMPIKLSNSELKTKLHKEYEDRLAQGNIPDPYSIAEKDWKNDVTKWPLLDLGKIFTFILKHKEFDADYIGKYKAEKAYSYFDSKFVGPILCTTVTESAVCILKTEVTPSQKIRDSPRAVWICARQNGDIVSAWCDCTAGFSQTCNHVIAASYKVEYAISKDYHKPACTSQACEWNQVGRKDILPSKVKNMDLRGASRKGDSSKKSSQARLAFEPRRQGDDRINPKDIQTFLSGLEGINKKAVLFTGFNTTTSSQSTAAGNCPPNVLDAANNIDTTEHSSEDVTNQAFMKVIALTEEQCNAIEVASRGQKNDVWDKQRKGRITASTAHTVHTKVETIMKKRKPAVVSTLVKNMIYGGRDISHLEDIKYGVKHEDDAKKIFYADEAVKHTNFTLHNPGLYVSSDLPYLAASPDYVMKCDCCGVSVVEIKCPPKFAQYSIKEHYPRVEFLKKDSDDNIILKDTHRYYTQILMQMAIVRARQGYFLTWNTIDPVIEKINFNSAKWAEIQSNLCLFYQKYVVPAILGVTPINFCVVCSDNCLWKHEVKEAKDRNAHCSTCGLWYHFKCILIEEAGDDWICDACDDAQFK